MVFVVLLYNIYLSKKIIMGNPNSKQNIKFQKQSLLTEYSSCEKINSQKSIYQFKNVVVKKDYEKLLEKINFSKIGLDIDAGKLQGGKWTAMEMYRLCPYIESWDIKQQLSVYNCQDPKILVHIQMIKFPYIKTLNLWGNNIESIQQLGQAFMPLLQSVWLWQNNITCIKPLRKSNFPNLSTLDLKKNPIIQYGSLSELNISKKILQRLDVETRNQKSMETNDMRWLVKLEAVYVSQLSVNKKDFRLSQEKLFIKLKPKIGKILC